MVSRRAADGSPRASQRLAVAGGGVEAVWKAEEGAAHTITDTCSTPTNKNTHTHTVTDHTNTHKYKQRHVPDRSSDLFLFWGSLGFFTGGLRFGGFSTLLGLSLSVPEHSEDKQVRYRRSLTWRHRRPRRGQPYLRRRTWPSCSSAASPAPEVWVLLPLNKAKMGKAQRFVQAGCDTSV